MRDFEISLPGRGGPECSRLRCSEEALFAWVRSARLHGVPRVVWSSAWHAWPCGLPTWWNVRLGAVGMG